MVFFSLARDNYVVAEVEVHARHQLSGLPDEASQYSSFIPMHTGPGGVPASVRPKVLATKSSSAYSAQ
jgi:hypothetical protein